MQVLRLSAGIFLASLVAAVWGLSAGACGHANPSQNYQCAVPVLTEIGKDGGPDPCHCQLPYVDPVNCPCNDQDFQICMQLLLASTRDAGDGGDGGP